MDTGGLFLTFSKSPLEWGSDQQPADDQFDTMIGLEQSLRRENLIV